MPYVTGAEILTHVGISAPTADETAWAATCADAVEAEIAHAMVGVTVDVDSAAELALIRAAREDGAAAFARRKAPHGILSVGPDGEAVRLGADVIIALRPVFARYATPGIG